MALCEIPGRISLVIKGLTQSIKLLKFSHTQANIFPFLLQRLKEYVLDRLPPKNYSILLMLNSKFYNKASAQHVFQTLKYLKNLVIPPALVPQSNLPQNQPILSKLVPKGLGNISQAPKLLALVIYVYESLGIEWICQVISLC
ncbi:uncharacterized protein VP01_5177g5 [Puccinia sorghi]|uniref:Uncharacterized protein n=1 Tax=Puccinia sorghi TaxID=27349 RepID=A0A0L6UKU1_9BASI|nr:uncharacterized protein VP01_5177g5 [Puccinia sorghi]